MYRTSSCVTVESMAIEFRLLGCDRSMENSTSTSADGLLRERALRGTLISLSGQGGAQALRLLSNLILARLLFPEAFGVMAIAWLMIATHVPSHTKEKMAPPSRRALNGLP